jgi:hypothetical protein
LFVILIAWYGVVVVADGENSGDSPQCRVTMLTITKCLGVGASAYIAGSGKVFLPESLSPIDEGFVCPCSGSRREKYVYLVSKDRQSFFLCCPVALRQAKQNSGKSFLYVSDCRFGRAKGDVELRFPFALTEELGVAEFLGFKFKGKYSCESFGKYRVLGVRNSDSFITVILNPSPIDLRLSKKFKLENKYSLTRSEVKHLIEQNRVTEPSVINELYKHSK